MMNTPKDTKEQRLNNPLPQRKSIKQFTVLGLSHQIFCHSKKIKIKMASNHLDTSTICFVYPVSYFVIFCVTSPYNQSNKNTGTKKIHDFWNQLLSVWLHVDEMHLVKVPFRRFCVLERQSATYKAVLLPVCWHGNPDRKSPHVPTNTEHLDTAFNLFLLLQQW